MSVESQKYRLSWILCLLFIFCLVIGISFDVRVVIFASCIAIVFQIIPPALAGTIVLNKHGIEVTKYYIGFIEKKNKFLFDHGVIIEVGSSREYESIKISLISLILNSMKFTHSVRKNVDISIYDSNKNYHFRLNLLFSSEENCRNFMQELMSISKV